MLSMIFKKLACFFALTAFVATSVVPPSCAQSVGDLPKAGSMVNLSQAFTPVVLRGMKVDPQDPFKFEFVVDPGNSGFQGDTLKDESTKLIRYFLASVTTPEKDLWVNLSPYEKDRIIPEAFGVTEMGRDLLSQDYILKQITSSLMYPENGPGKLFWQEIYKQAYDLYGTTDVPVDTFNKVWITPDTAEVYEDKGVAFVGDSHLKVMLESDYLAADHAGPETVAVPTGPEVQEMTKEIIRNVMLPVIEKEVNEGRNFAQLRQVYQSLILAAWYKKRLKGSMLNQVYADRNKVEGVDIKDRKESEKIWEQYVDAFKKGAYNYIKEEYDQYTQELIPRKYFSGGANMALIDKVMSFKPKGSIVSWGRWKNLITTGIFIATFAFVAPVHAATGGDAPGLVQTAKEKTVIAKQKAFVKLFENLPVDGARADGWDGLHVDREDLVRAQQSGFSGDTVSVRNDDGHAVARLFIKLRSDEQAAFLLLSADAKFKWDPSFGEWTSVYSAGALIPNISSRDDLKKILKQACLTQKKLDYLPGPVSVSQLSGASGAGQVQPQGAGTLAFYQGGVEYEGPSNARRILFTGVSQKVHIEAPHITDVVIGGDISGSLRGKEDFVREYLDILRHFLSTLPSDSKVSLLNMAVPHDIKADEPAPVPLIESGTPADVQGGLDVLAKGEIAGATDLYGALKKAVDLLPSDGKGVVVFGTDAYPDIFARKTGDPRQMLDIFKQKAAKDGLFESIVKKKATVIFFNNGQINPLFQAYIDEQMVRFPGLNVVFNENLNKVEANLLVPGNDVSFQLSPSQEGTFSVVGGQKEVLMSINLPGGGGEGVVADLSPTEAGPLIIQPDGRINLKNVGDDWNRINAVFYPRSLSAPISRLFNDQGLKILVDGSNSMKDAGFWPLLEDLGLPLTFFGIRPMGSGRETVARVPAGFSTQEFLKQFNPGSTNGVAGMNALLDPETVQKGDHILMVSDLEFNTGTMQLVMPVQDMQRNGVVVSVATTDATYKEFLTWMSKLSNPIGWEDLDFNVRGGIPTHLKGVLTALLTGGSVYHGPTLKDALLQVKQERSSGAMAIPTVMDQMDGGVAKIELVRKDGAKETRIYRLMMNVPLLPEPEIIVAVGDAVAGSTLNTMNSNSRLSSGREKPSGYQMSVDRAEKGGIDLNTDKLDLNIDGDGSAVVRAIDPVLFDQMQAATGLVPVMIGIRPANDLSAFVGL